MSEENKRVRQILWGIAIILILVGLAASFKTTDTPTRATPAKRTTTSPSVNYRAKFHGGYYVLLRGETEISADGEMFLLHENGSAKWIWMRANAQGLPEKYQEKPGTWTATSSTVTITTKGNSGNITDTFTFQDIREYKGLALANEGYWLMKVK